MRSLRPVRAWSRPGAPHNGEPSRGTSTKASKASGSAAASSPSAGMKLRAIPLGACAGSSARRVASAGTSPNATTSVLTMPWSNNSAVIRVKQAKPTPTRTSRRVSVSSSLSTSRPMPSAVPGARPNRLP